MNPLHPSPDTGPLPGFAPERVFWHRANDPDTIGKAAKGGFGIEVDVRSIEGVLFLNHDPIYVCPDWSFQHLLAGFPGEIILDIKETGILGLVIASLSDIDIPLDRCYAADLIVPDMLVAERHGLRTLARKSRYESIQGPFYGEWIDYVFGPEDLPETLRPAFLVSPELHQRPLTEDFIVAALARSYDAVCTDRPETWTHDRHRNQQRTPIPA